MSPSRTLTRHRPIHCLQCAEERGVSIPKRCPHGDTRLEFKVYCEPEDTEPDFELEDGSPDEALHAVIKARLANCEQWAWCYVKVEARLIDPVSGTVFSGFDGLGGCSYADEADFCQPDGYFSDMKARALEDLKSAMASTAAVGKHAEKLLKHKLLKGAKR